MIKLKVDGPTSKCELFSTKLVSEVLARLASWPSVITIITTLVNIFNCFVTMERIL